MLKTSLKQINNKGTLVNLHKDIVLVTRVLIFCRTLFTNNNIKIVIQMHTFLYDIVYQQQHKSRDSNAYLADGSS